jgi:hypothetical protein
MTYEATAGGRRVIRGDDRSRCFSELALAPRYLSFFVIRLGQRAWLAQPRPDAASEPSARGG